MTRRSGITLAILGVLCVALGACDRAPLAGPPTLRLGRDECGECGMIINEERCSSALLVERDGRREHVLYDDIGCMLDAEREGLHGRAVVERYVHDHASKQWVAVEDAWFLQADVRRLQTPMGSGLVAFKTRAAAEAGGEAHGGHLVERAELAAVRSAWLRERRGAPASGRE